MLTLTLRFVHILAMAAWFGATLFPSGDVRRTVQGGGDLPALAARLQRAGVVAAASAILTLLTGFTLIFVMGGMGAMPPGIHAGVAFGLAAFLTGAGGVGRTSGRIGEAIASKSDAATLEALSKRLTMWSGILHLLWVTTLLLMVFRGAI